MKRFLVAITLFSVLFYMGCSNLQTTFLDTNSQPPKESFQAANMAKNRLNIVTSFYPLYEIVRQVGGNNVTLSNLVPAGVEPHDYEPTPQDVIRLNQADLVVYNGVGLEPWADKILPELQQHGIKTFNISDVLKSDLLPIIETHEKNDGSQEHKLDDESINDPHFWLDPVNYQKEVQAITGKLIELDPTHQIDYEKNSQTFIKQLQNLDITYKNGFKNCKLDTFITNHAAFAYLAHRYNLNMISVSGLSPDSEPSLKAMTEIIATIKEKNVHYILTESLVSPKITDTLASETGAKTLVLNPLEGLTEEEMAQGKNYVSIMKDNLKNLQTALECQ